MDGQDCKRVISRFTMTTMTYHSVNFLRTQFNLFSFYKTPLWPSLSE